MNLIFIEEVGASQVGGECRGLKCRLFLDPESGAPAIPAGETKSIPIKQMQRVGVRVGGGHIHSSEPIKTEVQKIIWGVLLG